MNRWKLAIRQLLGSATMSLKPIKNTDLSFSVYLKVSANDEQHSHPFAPWAVSETSEGI